MSKDVQEKLNGPDPKQWIPEGVYCHGGTRDEPCPYWDSNPNQPYQLNGWCHYIQAGDWMPLEKGGTMLLWDQVKECGMNDPDHDWGDEDEEA